MIWVVGLGAGSPESVPAVALTALGGAARVLAPELSPEMLAALGAGGARAARRPARRCPTARRSRRPTRRRTASPALLPEARTLPDREALRARAIGAEVAALAEVGLRLRRECPWDRVQTAETIVPHTIEEAFEVADAVASGRRGPGRRARRPALPVGLPGPAARGGGRRRPRRRRARAGRQADQPPPPRLRRRRRRVGGRRRRRVGAPQARGARRPGHVPRAARRAARPWPTPPRCRSAPPRSASTSPTWPPALAKLDEEAAELREEPGARELGDVLFAAVGAARAVGADPELALRASAQRFRERVERAARLAAAAGDDFESPAAGAAAPLVRGGATVISRYRRVEGPARRTRGRCGDAAPARTCSRTIPARGEELTLDAGDLHLDYSKNRVDRARRSSCWWPSPGGRAWPGAPRRCSAASGSTSPRAGRCCTPRCARRATRSIEVDGHDVVPDVHEVLDRMDDLAERVRSGAWTGATGAAHPHRGQHRHRRLGPRPGDGRTAPCATSPTRTSTCASSPTSTAPTSRDAVGGARPGDDAVHRLPRRPSRRIETLTNARSAREWLVGRARRRRRGAPATSSPSRPTPTRSRRSASTPTDMLGFWDWVGGRYSMDSAIGLSLAIAIGAGAASARCSPGSG